MKKTNEQIKTEIVNYLTKTSNHTFVKPDGSYFKVFKKEDGTFQVFENKTLNLPIDIDQYIRWYGENAKNVIKHRLFLDKKMVGVKNIKTLQEIMAK
jgi:predicted acetyltransferase